MSATLSRNEYVNRWMFVKLNCLSCLKWFVLCIGQSVPAVQSSRICGAQAIHLRAGLHEVAQLTCLRCLPPSARNSGFPKCFTFLGFWSMPCVLLGVSEARLRRAACETERATCISRSRRTLLDLFGRGTHACGQHGQYSS